MPYVEKNYRVLGDRSSRAIAGLSMGGYQTLDVMIRRLDQFGYIGVFSSGVLRTPDTWERVYASALDDSVKKRGLKLLWFATGKDDPLMSNTKDSVALLKKHGFAPVFVESEGGHTWLNWRDYLSEFAPQLFR